MSRSSGTASLLKRPRKGTSASHRAYRRISPHADERTFQLVVEQSDLWITVRSDCAEDMEALALRRVNEVRAQIRAWMLLAPSFASALIPLPVPEHAPEVIRRMSAAAALMGVGPMAAVAGAVAALTAEELVKYSPDCLVENGGDSMLYSTRERVVGLLADPAGKAVFGLRLPREAFPVSLCASSARIGHSLSLGQGDLAVVKARDAFVADAAATAFCNMLQTPEDAGRAAERASSFAHAGIEGLFVQCGDSIGIWGDMELLAL